MYKSKLIGVSTVGGNANLDWCTINARKMLHMCEFDGSHNVYPGANRPLVRQRMFAKEVHGETGLDGTTTLDKIHLPEQDPAIAKHGSAISAMYKGIMATPKGTCWLLCTGPLTNAALLLSAHGDEICEHLKGLCFMGGAIALGNNNSSTEFNIAADPDAAKIVIETWGPQLKELVMVPLDVTMVALTNPMVRQRIEAIGSTLSKTITELIKHLCDRYVDTEELQAFGDMFKGQCEVHDACAVLYIWRPELFDARRMRVDVETASSFCYGTTCCDIYGRSNREVNVMVCEKTNVPEFWENVIEAIQQRSDVAQKKQGNPKSVKFDKKSTTVKKVAKKVIRKSPSPRSSTRSLTTK